MDMLFFPLEQSHVLHFTDATYFVSSILRSTDTRTGKTGLSDGILRKHFNLLRPDFFGTVPNLQQ